MPTQPEFGRRMRELRRAAGMSQAELAEPDLSASYVSLLESGKRVPSPEVVAGLAERLGVTPRSLLDEGTELPEGAGDDVAGDRSTDETGRFDLVGLLLRARKAEEEDASVTAAEQLTGILDQHGDDPHRDVLWEVRWSLARLHGRNGRADDGRRLLLQLFDDEYTRSSTERLERVARHLAELGLVNGNLPDGLRFAHLAWTLAEPLQEASVAVRAATVLVNACAWGGYRRWGREVADALVARISDEIPWPQRSAAYRESARLCLLNDDYAQARIWFECALEQTDPQQDINAWAEAQYYLAIAEFLVDQGLDEQVDERLARARPVIEVIGHTSMLVHLAVLEGHLALRRGEHDRARLMADAAVDAGPWPAVHEVGVNLLWTARIYRALGDTSTAAAVYRRAAELCEQGGAMHFCAYAWRELAELPTAQSLMDGANRAR
ncbi:helix-turn-helix transcriptional regulator [Streptomyces sp. ADMS]|uniref:helix-turn-helix domain-containing protein n=1 Tax=Streptomyces sp. ADMS TaxID=3071415 RepID=UPI00296FBFF2|nr:helix-turn-helix transcriptional regulator [Streptomyces sp. ADMS]MDW4910537.1 helix-turn-helix transcriptional regulator [Streptomyces sp. ADMS]